MLQDAFLHKVVHDGAPGTRDVADAGPQVDEVLVSGGDVGHDLQEDLGWQGGELVAAGGHGGAAETWAVEGASTAGKACLHSMAWCRDHDRQRGQLSLFPPRWGKRAA